MNKFSSKSHIYYIPVGLTQVQKDLLEILISIHAESFVSCVDKGLLPRLKNFEASDIKRDLSMTALTDVQLTEWFFENIRAVSNHPCLLVEHYMPRQFLLMEPSEKLVSTSDKFDKLNLIVNLLLNRKDKSRSLQIAIVSHSVKELDLIEGVMLGKVAKLKRLSGTSLFDEKHEYDEINAGSSASNADNASTSAVGSNETGSKSKDEYNYTKSKRRTKSVDLDWLFLATTTHLTHSKDLLSKYNLDIIISFDPLLDESLHSIYDIRNNGKKIPILKLLVQDSPDHYLLSQKAAKQSDDRDFLNSLAHFLKHRADNKDLITLHQYENIIGSLIKNDNPDEFIPKVDIGERLDDDLIPYLNEPLGLLPLKYGNFNLNLQHGPFDIKHYQLILKNLTAERLKQCHVEYDRTEKNVLEIRRKETLRLNEFDGLKEEIGQLFKKFKANEAKLNDSQKRVARTKNELDVLEERLNALNDRKKELLRLVELPDISAELETRNQLKSILTKELEAIRTENQNKTIQNDDLRSEYQQKSSEAAAEALRLSNLKNDLEQLDKKLA